MRWHVLPALLALALASCHSSSQTSGESKPATPAAQPAPAASQPTPPAKPEAAAAEPSLAVGNPAPDFALPGSDGHVHRLADDRGKRAVVVAWFPKAFTGG
ncbi:MAG: hypothetical protein ACM31C_02440 [Acidobacteriota bacterium]